MKAQYARVRSVVQEGRTIGTFAPSQQKRWAQVDLDPVNLLDKKGKGPFYRTPYHEDTGEISKPFTPFFSQTILLPFLSNSSRGRPGRDPSP